MSKSRKPLFFADGRSAKNATLIRKKNRFFDISNGTKIPLYTEKRLRKRKERDSESDGKQPPHRKEPEKMNFKILGANVNEEQIRTEGKMTVDFDNGDGARRFVNALRLHILHSKLYRRISCSKKATTITITFENSDPDQQVKDYQDLIAMLSSRITSKAINWNEYLPSEDKVDLIQGNTITFDVSDNEEARRAVRSIQDRISKGLLHRLDCYLEMYGPGKLTWTWIFFDKNPQQRLNDYFELRAIVSSKKHYHSIQLSDWLKRDYEGDLSIDKTITYEIGNGASRVVAAMNGFIGMHPQFFQQKIKAFAFAKEKMGLMFFSDDPKQRLDDYKTLQKEVSPSTRKGKQSLKLSEHLKKDLLINSKSIDIDMKLDAVRVGKSIRSRIKSPDLQGILDAVHQHGSWVTLVFASDDPLQWQQDYAKLWQGLCGKKPQPEVNPDGGMVDHHDEEKPPMELEKPLALEQEDALTQWGEGIVDDFDISTFINTDFFDDWPQPKDYLAPLQDLTESLDGPLVPQMTSFTTLSPPYEGQTPQQLPSSRDISSTYATQRPSRQELQLFDRWSKNDSTQSSEGPQLKKQKTLCIKF